MALPKPREQDTMSAVVNLIQQASPAPLSLFRDDDTGTGEQYREYHDVEVLNLYFERDKITWRKLHNDPNVSIVSETEKSNKIATLTYIKFVRNIPMGDPEPEPESDDGFGEPCDEDDPLIDQMWGG